MSGGISIRSATWNCNWAKVDGSNAARMQSDRVFNPDLLVVSQTPREYNDLYSGRPSNYNAVNGSYNSIQGLAGLNPSGFIGLENSLRQVEDIAPCVSASYDTMGVNRVGSSSQKVGAVCGVCVPQGEYTNTPCQAPMHLSSAIYQSALASVGNRGIFG